MASTRAFGNLMQSLAHLLKDVWPVTRVATVTARQYNMQYSRLSIRQYNML